jgi:hypothetical protein
MAPTPDEEVAVMNQNPIFASSRRGRDPLPRLLSAAALLVSIAALIFSMNGTAPAERTAAAPSQAARAKRMAAQHKAEVKLNKKAEAKLNKKLAGLKANCPISGAINMGTWCLESSTYKVPPAEAGKNNYLYATQKCVAEGGWLPTAAQLIGAAPVAALKSTLNDDPGTSGASEFPEAKNGIKDEREMTADLFTTGAGSRAAGSEGVSIGATGVGNTGEPNPVPVPAEPLPETLDYVTVYDNHNVGGFAGGEPVGKAENFRCAYAKGYQGKPRNTSSRS